MATDSQHIIYLLGKYSSGQATSNEVDQLLALLRDLRDRLHRGRARPDHANAFCGEVDAVMRPLAGVITLALE